MIGKNRWPSQAVNTSVAFTHHFLDRIVLKCEMQKMRRETSFGRRNKGIKIIVHLNLKHEVKKPQLYHRYINYSTDFSVLCINHDSNKCRKLIRLL